VRNANTIELDMLLLFGDQFLSLSVGACLKRPLANTDGGKNLPPIPFQKQRGVGAAEAEGI
jgi:hypothetical protein